MMTRILRSLNILAILFLLWLSGCLSYIFFTREKTEYSVREFTVVESTLGQYEETEQFVFEEVNLQEDPYTDIQEWEIRYPDEDLPVIEGIEQDAYGNYILTQEMFDNPDSLPFNEEGIIPYVFYYDYDSRLLNPMPELYNNYLEYYGQYGG